MKLKYCSITGADDAVDPRELLKLSQEFPFVEWAIWLMPERMGGPRAPKMEWILQFLATCTQTHHALHLCGEGLLNFVKNDPVTVALTQHFPRIQLNIRFDNVIQKLNINHLFNKIKQDPASTFIIQYADDNANLLPELKKIPNHQIFFDASAGTGVSPDAWPAPLAGHSCGYAGGIGPENVKDHLEKIGRVSQGQETWIDMESRVRTNDVFDLSKVKRVLEIVKNYS